MSFNPDNSTISGATDASIDQPDSSHFLKYDTGSQKWVNEQPAIESVDGLQGTLDAKAPADPVAGLTKVYVSEDNVIPDNLPVNTLVVESGIGSGPVIPAGGTTGQILAKESDTDYDTQWIDTPTGQTLDDATLSAMVDDQPLTRTAITSLIGAAFRPTQAEAEALATEFPNLEVFWPVPVSGSPPDPDPDPDPPDPDGRTVVFSEMYSSANENQAALTSRGPDNLAGGTVTATPTVGTWVSATAGTVATSTTAGTVGGLEVGPGLRLGAALSAGVDIRFRYTVPAAERHAEFTITSPVAITNIIVALHENGPGTYAWVQANNLGLHTSGDSSFSGSATSLSTPYAQGDRVRVSSAQSGGNTVVTATNLTAGQSTSVTIPSANVTALANLSIIYPAQYGRGSIDNLIIYEGQPE